MNAKTVGLIVIVAGATLGSAFLSVWYVEASNTLTMQTTTSMNDTGFLEKIRDALLPATGIRLRWISAGTGAAIAAAGDGNADLVIVHSATYEKEFINHTSTTNTWSGKGIARVNFAYNYFVVVGPTADPAGVSDTSTDDSYPGSYTNGTKAFHKIWNYTANGGSALFCSRGDQSGTHTKELTTWAAASTYNKSKGGPGFDIKTVAAPNTWYKNLTKGMGDTLQQANEMGAYTLTDYGTWLTFRDKLTNLALLMGNAADFKNTYSLISCDPDKLPYVKFELVKKFYYWFFNQTDGGLKVMDDFKIDGEQVFTKLLKCDCFCHSAKCMVENGDLYTRFGLPSCPAPATISML